QSPHSKLAADAQENLAETSRRVGFLHRLSDLIDVEARFDVGRQHAGAHQRDDATKQLQHREYPLIADPVGEPESLDALLPADQESRIERDRLAGQRAVDQEASARRQAAHSLQSGGAAYALDSIRHAGA